jgi:F-type H+-transporting ATPase subunit b
MQQQVKRRSSRLNRGAIPKWLLPCFAGFVMIVAGVFIKDQPWTTPAMFKDLGLDLGKTAINIGFFLLFIQVINIYFWKPLSEAMHDRESELEKTFTEAEDLRTRMDSMKAEYEQRLAATEAEARETIQTQIKEAQDLRQKLMSEAAEKADELVRKAEQEIDQERTRVLTELRIKAVDLTLAATEKLIGENMDSDKNRRLVTEFIDKVEVPG